MVIENLATDMILRTEFRDENIEKLYFKKGFKVPSGSQPIAILDNGSCDSTDAIDVGQQADTAEDVVPSCITVQKKRILSCQKHWERWEQTPKACDSL